MKVHCGRWGCHGVGGGIKNYLNKITATGYPSHEVWVHCGTMRAKSQSWADLLQQLILILIVIWKMKQSDLSTKQVHQI